MEVEVEVEMEVEVKVEIEVEVEVNRGRNEIFRTTILKNSDKKLVKICI